MNFRLLLLTMISNFRAGGPHSWFNWVAEVLLSVGLPLVLFQPQKLDGLLLCLGFAGFIFALLWLRRMVLRLFEEGVRLCKVGLIAVNQGVEQLWECFISGKKYSLELWSRGSLLSFALVEYAVYLCTAYLVWRKDNKVLHHTIYVGILAFSLFFLYEIVPPYDNPQACFTMRFFSRLEMWVCWACGRIVRWFTLSGF